MPPATITVPYRELHEGLKESYDQETGKATKCYRVDWNNRWRFALDMAGHVDFVGGTLVTYPPYQYPDNSFLYANALEIEPMGRSAPGAFQIAYDYAKCTVTFSTAPIYQTVEMNFAGEMLSFPGKGYKFSSDNKQVESPVGKLMPTMELTITANRVPNLDPAIVFAAVGCVNVATFQGAVAEQLLFLGASSRRTANINGLVSHDMTYKFIYKTISWNQFIRPEGNGFDTIVEKLSGNKVYSSYDFTQLFVANTNGN